MRPRDYISLRPHFSISSQTVIGRFEKEILITAIEIKNNQIRYSPNTHSSISSKFSHISLVFNWWVGQRKKGGAH